jgi:hypothetical protein
MAEAPMGNYHVDIWAEPPEYVCLLCLPTEAFRGTVEAVTQHLATVHETEAVPTAVIESLLAYRATVMSEGAPGAQSTAAADVSGNPGATPTEETPHA